MNVPHWAILAASNGMRSQVAELPRATLQRCRSDPASIARSIVTDQYAGFRCPDVELDDKTVRLASAVLHLRNMGENVKVGMTAYAVIVLSSLAGEVHRRRRGDGTADGWRSWCDVVGMERHGALTIRPYRLRRWRDAKGALDVARGTSIDRQTRPYRLYSDR